MFVAALWACGALMACGVAWMFSMFLSSTVISTGIAIAVLVATAAMIGVLADANAWPESYAGLVWCVVSLSTGIATFVGGSFHFLRRVQP